MPRDDAGTSLVEILVALVIAGTVIAALLAAVQTSIRSSAITFKASEVETVLFNASDRVARAPQRCEYDQYVQAAALAAGWPADSITVEVERLTASDDDPDTDWSAQVCPADVAAFDVQRLVITATDPTGEITRTRTVVKSDVE
ncbi:MAG: hypothetical protein AB8G26_07945 [Ilumatobacter sp.]